MDCLSIIDLGLWTRIGVPKEERAAEQRLLVGIDLHFDATPAAKSDDVKKSINYADVTANLRKIATTERKTIERFAEDAAQMILKKYKPQEVTVSVKKFAIPGTTAVEIIIHRKKI